MVGIFQFPFSSRIYVLLGGTRAVLGPAREHRKAGGKLPGLGNGVIGLA
jgi:hypothetical protein